MKSSSFAAFFMSSVVAAILFSSCWRVIRSTIGSAANIYSLVGSTYTDASPPPNFGVFLATALVFSEVALAFCVGN